jgi:hypothetical protein
MHNELCTLICPNVFEKKNMTWIIAVDILCCFFQDCVKVCQLLFKKSKFDNCMFVKYDVIFSNNKKISVDSKFARLRTIEFMHV